MVTMLKNWKFFTLTVFYTLTSNVSSNVLSTQDSYLTGTSSVNLQDGQCGTYIWSCTREVPNIPDVTSYKWIYFTHNPSVYVQIFDGITIEYDNSTYFTLTLTQDCYNPGFYECQMTFDGGLEPYSHAFQVDPFEDIPRVDLNGGCDAASDCYALNSQCVNSTCDYCADIGTCQCVAPYDINFNGLDTTPACLTNESVGSHCNIDEECAVQNSEDDIKCINNVCAIDVNACNDDEDCAANYKCVDNECTEMSAADDTGLSGGAIAGIVIGSLAGVALIGGVVYFVFIKINYSKI